jgi:hypothetical protein
MHLQEFTNRNILPGREPIYDSPSKPEIKTEDFTEKEKQILLLL